MQGRRETTCTAALFLAVVMIIGAAKASEQAEGGSGPAFDGKKRVGEAEGESKGEAKVWNKVRAMLCTDGADVDGTEVARDTLQRLLLSPYGPQGEAGLGEGACLVDKDAGCPRWQAWCTGLFYHIINLFSSLPSLAFTLPCTGDKQWGSYTKAQIKSWMQVIEHRHHTCHHPCVFDREIAAPRVVRPSHSVTQQRNRLKNWKRRCATCN